jgi:tripartite-type tricarboxylate transporter receptor subunit TctC
VQWLGLLATGGTPKGIVAKINAEVNRALREPDLVAKLAAQGTTAAGGTSEEFKTLIATEIRDWKETAHRANIKVE